MEVNIAKTPLETVMKNYRDGVMFNISDKEFNKVVEGLRLPALDIDNGLSNYENTVKTVKKQLHESIITKAHGYLTVINPGIWSSHHNVVVRLLNLTYKGRMTIVINDEIVYIPDNLVSENFTLSDLTYYYGLSKQPQSKIQKLINKLFHFFV